MGIRDSHRPAGGSQEDVRGAGAEVAMRKIPGGGMRWYPLQSLTQTQGKTVWVRYGSAGKSEETKEQVGPESRPVTSEYLDYDEAVSYTHLSGRIPPSGFPELARGRNNAIRIGI